MKILGRSSLFNRCICERKKSFITFMPGINVMKLFSLSLTVRASKLERLSIIKPFQPILIFMSEARVFWRGALLTNIRLGPNGVTECISD